MSAMHYADILAVEPRTIPLRIFRRLIRGFVAGRARDGGALGGMVATAIQGELRAGTRLCPIGVYVTTRVHPAHGTSTL